MLIALADVAVVVSDSKASARWWVRNLGFATHTIGKAGHAVLVAPPGDRFVLHLCEGFAPIEPGDSGIAFITDDITKLVARMARGSVHFPVPLRTEKWGRMAKFADPDGNIFWLLEVPTPMVRATLGSRAPAQELRGATMRKSTRKRRKTRVS